MKALGILLAWVLGGSAASLGAGYLGEQAGLPMMEYVGGHGIILSAVVGVCAAKGHLAKGGR